MTFSSRRVLIFLLLFLSTTLMFRTLDAGGIPSYDDGYYAQKAREMMTHGRLLTPTFGGHPYFDNPPGFMWLLAGSFQIFGTTEFGARFPSAAAGVLGILGTFFLFELLFTTRIGFLAGLILSLTTLYLKYSRHAMMDVTVTASVVWCYYFFVRALREQDKPHLFLLSGLAGSYVMFAKSVFGLVVLGVLFFYTIFARYGRAFGRLSLWVGLLLFVLPYAFWCVWSYVHFGGEFTRPHFYNLIFGMARHGGANDHIYDYVLVLLKYFPIYLPFMLWGLWLAMRSRGEAWRSYALPAFYFLIFFVALSLQGTKKTWYFIPALPACAGLAALGLDRAARRLSLEQIARGVAVLALLLHFLFLLTPIPLSSDRALEIRQIAPYVRAAGKQGYRILGYNIDRIGLNASLLFYSDREAEGVEKGSLAQQLSLGGKVLMLISPEEWEQVRAEHPALSVVRRNAKWVVVVNEPLSQEEIFP